jgi:hypothetical protein
LAGQHTLVPGQIPVGIPFAEAAVMGHMIERIARVRLKENNADDQTKAAVVFWAGEKQVVAGLVLHVAEGPQSCAREQSEGGHGGQPHKEPRSARGCRRVIERDNTGKG